VGVSCIRLSCQYRCGIVSCYAHMFGPSVLSSDGPLLKPYNTSFIPLIPSIPFIQSILSTHSLQFLPTIHPFHLYLSIHPFQFIQTTPNFQTIILQTIQYSYQYCVIRDPVEFILLRRIFRQFISSICTIYALTAAILSLYAATIVLGRCLIQCTNDIYHRSTCIL